MWSFMYLAQMMKSKQNEKDSAYPLSSQTLCYSSLIHKQFKLEEKKVSFLEHKLSGNLTLYENILIG